MDQKLLDHCKAVLLKQKKEILHDANKVLNAEESTQKEGMPDTVDRSSMETDRSFMLRLRDRERKLLKKIDKALDRIKDNTFGICNDCEDDISIKRLKARPVATLCINCKEDQEREEKLNLK